VTHARDERVRGSDAAKPRWCSSRASIVESPRGRDYAGWHVLEQDTILTEEPHGEGPVADVATNVEHLRTLQAAP
jgi:hypothetical protein